MVKKIFRFIFTFCGMLFGYGISNFVLNESSLSSKISFETESIVLLIAMFTGFFGLIFLYFFNANVGRAEKLAKRIENFLGSIPPMELASSIAGLIIGIIVAALLSQIINGIKALQTAYINVIISVLLYAGLGIGGLFLLRGIVLRFRGGDVTPFIREKNGKSKAAGSVPKIFDTSVIIDGRIADIMKTGFIEGDIVIPDFVLVELRHIADSADGLKRNRGRRGLDVLDRIQEEYGIEIYNTASDKSIGEIPEVDVKLLKLAQKLGGMVVTNDYNLNKVASIQGVGVLNINELANTLKPAVLPGEEMQVYLVKEGKEPSQGVAYLDDGTMIVVEDGRRLIGQTVSVTVTSVLQTSAGRMIFAKL